MAQPVEIATTCPACLCPESGCLETISVSEQHRHYAPDNPKIQEKLTSAARAASLRYTMQRCLRCGLEYGEPLIAPNSEWYRLAYETLNLYPSERWEFDRVIQQLRAGERVYEVGCGSGAFLKLCREKKILARGGDFSESAVKQCRELGLDAEVVDFASGTATVSESAAGQIVAFHVLEHLDDPGSLFRFSAEVAHRNAVLWIAVPSDRRPSRLLRETDLLDQPPHHMTRWNEPALRTLGARFGWLLRTIEYERIPSKAAVWWIASRAGAETNSHGWIGRASLWARYPSSWVRLKREFSHMTGFAMLAQFRRTVDAQE